MSDQIALGRLENFTGGWALPIKPTSMKAHYFQRWEASGMLVMSLCGRTDDSGYLLNPGTFEKCKHCLRMRGE